MYSITGYDADKVSIKAGEKLTTKEYEDIRSIFYGETNYTNGWVIVGTTYQGESQAVADDVSNDMTFRAFVREYLVNDSKDIIVVDSTENGEWLKVIDNDGDGAAEYIFKTEFAMAEIDNITSKGVYTFTELADIDAPQLVPDTADDLDVDGKDIVTGDELAEGDIVLYTLIDGKYYVDIATMVTGTVDKKGINSKDETISVDGTVYTQSHIGYSDAPDTSYNYYSDVTEGHTEETYDLYLDHFGYVRLFAESAYNRGFVLLTDGYYWTDNRTEDFQATIYDLDADELVDVDVSDKGASRFIETDEGHTGDRGTWGRLEKVVDVYKTPAFTKANQYVTNIAAYAEADGVYTLADAENASNRENYWVHEVDTNGIKLNERNLTSLTRDDLFGDRRIQTVTTTQYYLVVRENDANGNASSKIVDILTWTGYKNAPAEAELGSDTVAYAVAHTSDSYAYAVADVVVFETNTTADKDTYFVYETNNWRTEYVWGIGYDADDKIVDDRVYVEVNAVPAEIEFYEITEKGGMSIIDDDYADHNIYAGYVDVIDDTTKYDYFQVGNTAAGDLYFSPEEGSDEYAPLFQVYVNRLGDYDVELVDDWADIHLGTGMILFTDNKGNVEYAIYVGDVMSLYDVEDAPLAAVEDLFWAIVRDAAYVPTDFEAAMAKAEAAIVTGTIEALTEAKKALEDLYTVKADGSIVTNLTNEEYNHVKGMLAKVEAELAPLVADKELAEAKTAALAKIEEKKGEWTQGMIDAAKAAVDAAKTEADLDWASKITARAGEIQNAQNVAKAAVDSKVTGLTQTNYNAAEWSAILNIQTQAKADIDKASTDEAITAIQNKAIADIEAVKTAAVVEGEKLLNNAKEAIEAALEDGSLKVSDATLAAATGIEGKVNDALSSASVTGVTVKVEGVQNYASSVTCTVTLSLTTPVIGVGNVVMNNVTINEGV